MVKLQFTFCINILDTYVKSKSKQKWFYRYFPLKLAEGFTLAEVLITLLIIGIVASLVIPNLINETNEEELHTAWKKNYAEISSAFNRARMENGGTFVGVCNDGDNNCLRNLVMPYLNYTKSCNQSYTNGANQCIYNTNYLKKYSGQIFYDMYWPASALKLSNGAIVFFADTDKACDFTTNSSRIKWCGSFFVDVNGYKQPNKVGVDVYHGRVMSNGTLPAGAFDMDNSAATVYNISSCDKSNLTAQGWGCSAKFLSQ